MKRFLALLLLGGATSAFAQNSDIEALSGLQFNFGNPGARSLGMGGAFIGLADDASAAEANPAGLTILRKTEASLELRGVTMAQRFVTGGTFPYVTSQDFPSRETNVTFASIVVPLEPVVLAAYYHRPLTFRNHVDTTGRFDTPVFYLGASGPVSPQECGSDCTRHQIYPFSTSVDLQMETFGLAMARQWRTLSVGAAVRYHRFSETADTFRRDLDAPGQPTFMVTQTNGGQLLRRSSDRDMTFAGGLKWTPIDRLSLGAVYKKGATFPVGVSAGFGTNRADLQLVESTDFHAPATLGVGVSYRPGSQLTINADVVRVGYGKLSDHFISVIEYGTENGGTFEDVSGYQTRNGTELHAGVEYFILSPYTIGIRAGWWRDPAHAIAYRGALLTSHDVAAQILFPGTQAENHYSVGIGLALPRLGIDIGYDTSRSLRSASFSIIARR